MTSTDLMFQNALLAFAAIYITLALVRIFLQWKHIKAIVEANATQKERVEQATFKSQEGLGRLEALRQDRQEELRRSEELWRQSEESQKRSASILSRLEVLLEKWERQQEKAQGHF